MTTIAIVHASMQQAERDIREALSHSPGMAATKLAEAYQRRTSPEKDAMALVLIGWLVSDRRANAKSVSPSA
jgi:hypothetical protein